MSPYKESCHPIFGSNEQEREEIRKEFGLKESTIDEEVDAILEWFEKQPHLMEAGIPDREFVERMLIFAKGSREKTKHRIDNFYKYRALAPELVQDREKHIHPQKDMWSFYCLATIPQLFNLKRITIIQFDPDSSKFDCETLFRNSTLMGDIRLKYDYSIGDIWILDLKDTGLSHLLRMNPTITQKALQIFQEGLGVRMFAIHVLHAPIYTPQLVNFFGRFTKPKIMDRIIFHSCLKDLHKYVPTKYLPKDYGGEQPNMEELKEIIHKVLEDDETKQLIACRSKQHSDESRRLQSTINEEHMAGSFKKLDID